MENCRGRVVRLWRTVAAMEISLHGASASFFIILSVFPGLVLMLGLLRYLPLEAADLMELAADFLPEAIHEFTWQMIQQTDANTARVVLSVSALTALWSAGRGIYGLLKGLNSVYGVREERGWLRIRMVSAVYTLLFLLALLLTLTLHVFGGTVAALLESRGIRGFGGLRFIVLVLMQTFLFCAMYMFLPGRRNRFGESFPGAVCACLGWMGVSALYSVYVRHFSGMAAYFGSVYVVALAMLWLYVCVCIVYFGAALNRILAEK
ncbi:MAG: YihY/virulence factor BrkB family protein [Oscillospiraceae bacterium]|nr:YihY/virulence factor BrkB family protein [Oscillospiraceae bacterium]